ncbi:hypothetical protein, partial [Bacillus hominis]|uniref:hypothetical protein n=1 Tax=Bacillus hominis TaxID=2817478 RepID=UPI001BB32460
RTVEGQDVVEGLAYFKGNYYIWNTDMENSDEPKVQQLYEYDLKNIHKLQLEQHQFLKSKIEEYVLEQRIRLLLEETDTKEAIRKLVNYISDLYKEQVLDECEVAFLADENYITVQIEGVFEQEVVAALGVRNNLFSSYDRNKHMLFLNLEDILAIGDQLISLILNSITLWQDWKSKRVEKQENLIPKLQKEGVDNEERVRL